MATQKISTHNIMWLALGITLASLPHWPRLAIWISLLQVALLCTCIIMPLRLPTFWSAQKTTINWLRLIIMLGSIFAIYGHYGTLAGRDVGIALLVLLTAFKIAETQSKRDYYISTYLGYFLIITNFFYSQTIPTVVYMMFVVVTMTVGLISFNDTEQQLTLSARLKLSATLLLQSLPLLLVMFILFPRVNGPLWGLPKDAHVGMTGVNDQMSPGTISKLAQSKEIAFRVSFVDKIPDPAALYWRGPVLWHTDGRKWTTGKSRPDPGLAMFDYKSEMYRYDLIMEPTNKRWLFGLELVSVIPDDTYLTYDYQLKLKKPLQARKLYSLTSTSAYKLGSGTQAALERGLALPGQKHPKARALAATLRDEFTEPALIMNAALDWLKREDFVYTLEPPLMTEDVVDEFLFDTRQGFCEHYAAAFTILMRAAGIPARVVTGYQGGEINPMGNFLTVRQYHAHAWTEVWLDNRGWLRVDPTAMAAPGRVSEGIENTLPEAIMDIPLGLERNAAALRLWQQLSNLNDMANYQWTQWVLGYGPNTQRMLLHRLGFGAVDWQGLTFALMLLLGVMAAAIAAYGFTKRPKANDAARAYYNIFCKLMAKIGLPVKSYEGPLDFARRTAAIRQDIGSDIKNITDLYIAIRYRSNNKKLPQLKAKIKSFAPTKTR